MDNKTLKELKKIETIEELRIYIAKHDKKASIEERLENFQRIMSGFRGVYPNEILKEFYYYWTEPNESNTKMRFEMEKTWDTNRRLLRWSKSNLNKTFKERDEANLNGISSKTEQIRRLSKLREAGRLQGTNRENVVLLQSGDLGESLGDEI